MRIREGDPLEIYTDREGEVIFKKYSPIGEMNSFAAQYAEALHRTADMCVVITDRDAVIAVAGVPKKSYADRSLSTAVEELISARSYYSYGGGDRYYVTEDEDGEHYISALMPIISGGDITGSVISLAGGEHHTAELEAKLIQTAASFLAKQLEE